MDLTVPASCALTYLQSDTFADEIECRRQKSIHLEALAVRNMCAGADSRKYYEYSVQCPSVLDLSALLIK